MKKALRYASLLALSIVSQAQPDSNSECLRSCDTTNKTYFSVRPQFQLGSPEYLSLSRKQRLKADCKWGGTVQATVFGGQSTNKKGLGTYFMPFGSSSVDIDGTISEGSSALLPQHFNIFSVKFGDLAMIDNAGASSIEQPYKSTISLSPHQSVIGLGLSWEQGFAFKGHKLFLTLSGPVMNVENSMGLCENVVSNNLKTVTSIDGTNLATPQTSMIAALSQNAWCFGKIACKDRNRTDLAFIQARVGYVVKCKKNCSLESFIGLTIPTARKSHSAYMFNPVVGNGGHVGLLWGSSAWMKLCTWNNMHVAATCDVVSQYLFKNTQQRSFDLKYKPWSRYMELYKDKVQAVQAANLKNNPTEPQSVFLASPGINTLTDSVHVEPGFNFTSNVALVLEPCHDVSGFNAEIGYNFYAREAECLKLKNKCDLTAAVKSFYGQGIVDSVRDMTNDALHNDGVFYNDLMNMQLPGNSPKNPLPGLPIFDKRKLKTSDFDLKSAAHPCTISHTLYGSVGYAFNTLCLPLNCSLGGSFEFTDRNTALERWLVWGKIGFSY